MYPLPRKKDKISASIYLFALTRSRYQWTASNTMLKSRNISKNTSSLNFENSFFTKKYLYTIALIFNKWEQKF